MTSTSPSTAWPDRRVEALYDGKGMTTRSLSNGHATIHIVEQDPAVAKGLCMLFRALDASVKTYPDAETFLDAPPGSDQGCLIIEMNLPGMDGLALLDRLRAEGVSLPAIMLSSKSDIATAVEAMRAGAFDFLEKPFIDRVLLERVREALTIGADTAKGVGPT